MANGLRKLLIANGAILPEPNTPNGGKELIENDVTNGNGV
jgi:hypothetical protein